VVTHGHSSHIVQSIFRPSICHAWNNFPVVGVMCLITWSVFSEMLKKLRHLWTLCRFSDTYSQCGIHVAVMRILHGCGICEPFPCDSMVQAFCRRATQMRVWTPTTTTTPQIVLFNGTSAPAHPGDSRIVHSLVLTNLAGLPGVSYPSSHHDRYVLAFRRLWRLCRSGLSLTHFFFSCTFTDNATRRSRPAASDWRGRLAPVKGSDWSQNFQDGH
jgi:hypothetical protein